MVSERQAFGERLKRYRERSGTTLEAISKASKVPVSLFAGLERGDCSRWPAAIYARAYVRAYAEAIGLNAQQIVADFSAAFGDAPMEPEPNEMVARRVSRAARLRLSMAEEPADPPERIARRAALAAVDLLIGCLIVAIAYVGLGASVWMSVAGVLLYHAAGRMISDEPLLFWLYEHARTESKPAAAERTSEEVPVGDAARTVA